MRFTAAMNATRQETVTVLFDDGRKFTFVVDFETLQSLDDLDGVVPDVLALIGEYLEGC